MKVNITSTSNMCVGHYIREVASIDEALNMIRNDKSIVEKRIDKAHSSLYNKTTKTIRTPKCFVVSYTVNPNYDVQIEMYDDYRE